MSEPTTATAYPYATHLDILFGAMQTIDVGALAESVKDEWYNQTLCRVNDAVVRIGVIRGEYHWHKHQNEDEFFFVLSGYLLYRAFAGAAMRGGDGVDVGRYARRRIARILGGDITVESEGGHGSTFTLWLPPGAPQQG